MVFKKCVLLFAMLAFCSAEAGNNLWTSTGPFGGSFERAFFEPQDGLPVFITGPGGLFRSANHGVTWKVVAGLRSAPVAFSRTNPNLLYIGGDSAIYRSEDQGVTLQRISQNFSGRTRDLVIGNTDPGIQYAISTNSRTNAITFFKSSDGGVRWKPSHPFKTLSQLRIDPSNASVLYALVDLQNRFETGAAKSTDGGNTWRKILKGAQFIAVDPANGKILYSRLQDFVRSTDGGNTWKEIPCGCLSDELFIDAKNPSHLYARDAQNNRLAKSTNSGSSWTALKSPIPGPDRFLSPLLGVQNDLVLIGAATRGVMISKDGAKTFKFASQGVNAAGIPRVQKTSTGMIAIDENDVYRTDGKIWKRISVPTPGFDGEVNEMRVHPKNPNRVFLVKVGVVVLESLNAGRTWKTKSEGTFNFTTCSGAKCVMEFDPRNDDTIYFGGGFGINKTTDAGKTFEEKNSGLPFDPITALAASKLGDVLLAGSISGEIYLSRNGADQWTKKSTGLQGTEVGEIAIDPSNSNVAYATVGGKLFKTTNAGTRWIIKNKGFVFSKLPPVVRIDPSNSSNIYVAGDQGVFISTDSGETFSGFDMSGLDIKTFIFSGAGDFFSNVSRFIDFQIQPATGTFLLGTQRGVFSYTTKTQSPGAPVIEQIAPSTARIGDTVSINGRNFGGAQADSKIFFGSIDAGQAISYSDTKIKVTVPEGAVTGKVSVTVSQNRSNEFSFVVVAPQGSVIPDSGPSSGGTVVSFPAPSFIKPGTLFDVTFDETLASGVELKTNPGVIVCTSPPGTGVVKIRVVSATLTTEAGTFSYDQ